MTETQRKALQAAEDAFRRYADHHAMKGDETKARANMALADQMAAAQVECAAPVAAQIRHQDEDGQWSEWAGIPLSHAYSNFLPSVQVRLLYEAGHLSPRMTGTDHAAELAHRTCSRYKHDQNPALVEYTFNRHTLGDFVQKLVTSGIGEKP